jgi:hypothetical protein
VWLESVATLAPEAMRLAREVAQTLLSQGAREMIVAAQKLAAAAKRDPRSAPSN